MEGQRKILPFFDIENKKDIVMNIGILIGLFVVILIVGYILKSVLVIIFLVILCLIAYTIYIYLKNRVNKNLDKKV
jgi:divalent metal cation (Fe/Co/Zn/Cd) transporter